MTSPQRPRAAATPTASPEGATAELLPCPLCGSEAYYERKGSPRQSTIVCCTECGCSVESGDTVCPWTSWNRRTPDLAARQEIERLTEELGIAQTLVVSRGLRVLDLGNRMMDAIQRAEAAESALAAQAQRRDEVVAILWDVSNKLDEWPNDDEGCANAVQMSARIRRLLNTPEPK